MPNKMTYIYIYISPIHFKTVYLRKKLQTLIFKVSAYKMTHILTNWKIQTPLDISNPSLNLQFKWIIDKIVFLSLLFVYKSQSNSVWLPLGFQTDLIEISTQTKRRGLM